jgi:mono/diheme cytochrome c family protein
VNVSARTAPIRATLVIAMLAAKAAAAAPVNYTLPDETTQLRPGDGPAFEAARTCTACHSADYLATQPPGRGAAFWQAEVTKMVKLYHAPIDDADAKLIVEYLAKAY